jgi:hypothetical protein
MKALGQVFEIFFRVGSKAGQGSFLGEVNGPPLMLDGQTLRVHSYVGIYRAEQLLQGFDLLGCHRLQLGSLLLADHREVLRVPGPCFLARPAAHEDLDALEDDELLQVDFIVHHKRTRRLPLSGLGHCRAGQQNTCSKQDKPDGFHGALLSDSQTLPELIFRSLSR